jgi:hypothetical protein
MPINRSPMAGSLWSGRTLLLDDLISAKEQTVRNFLSECLGGLMPPDVWLEFGVARTPVT